MGSIVLADSSSNAFLKPLLLPKICISWKLNDTGNKDDFYSFCFKASYIFMRRLNSEKVTLYIR